MSFRFPIIAALTDAAAGSTGSFVPRKIQSAYFDTKKTAFDSTTSANYSPTVDNVGMLHKLQPETDGSIQHTSSKTLRNVDFQGLKDSSQESTTAASEDDSIDLGILGNNPNRELQSYCTARPLVRNDVSFPYLIQSCLSGSDECPYSVPVQCFDTSEVTDMSDTFKRNPRWDDWYFNSDLSGWDTSKVTRFDSMFEGLYEFNQPLDSWDTSKAEYMDRMFQGASRFNQPLDSWDTSKVVMFFYMFERCSQFNQPLGSWNTSKAKYMDRMFYSTAFNQPLGSWDVGEVLDFMGMFEYNYEFNQPLDSWDTSKATGMYGMFYKAPKFNQPLGSWDVGKVKYFNWMFANCSEFNQPLDSWDTSKATSMYSMFYGATSFNQPLGSWDVGKVTGFNQMFADCSEFNQPLDSWDTSKAAEMTRMFYHATSFNQPLHEWNISAVSNNISSNIDWMFVGARSFNQCLSSWAKYLPFADNYYNDTVFTLFEGTSCPYTENPSKWCQGANQQCEDTDSSVEAPTFGPTNAPTPLSVATTEAPVVEVPPTQAPKPILATITDLILGPSGPLDESDRPPTPSALNYIGRNIRRPSPGNRLPN